MRSYLTQMSNLYGCAKKIHITKTHTKQLPRKDTRKHEFLLVEIKYLHLK